MRSARLDQMKGGWFLGDFDPSVIRTKQFEVGIKSYLAGQHESAHVHERSSEITVVVSGVIQMAGERWVSGDIIVLDPGEPSAFFAETDARVVVVKWPSVPGDKILL